MLTFLFSSFWDNNINAVLLTDTCYKRGYMRSCKTSPTCDTVSKIPANGLSFMYSALYSVMKLTKKFICGGKQIYSDMFVIVIV